jgi:glycosyltransferase involved in cell wall biosynthesis
MPGSPDGGRPLSITWVLPRFQSFPSGGYRVVYEYANHLAARGHSVTALHPLRLGPALSPGRWWRRSAWSARIRRLRDRGRVTWFEVDARVDMRIVRSLDERHVPSADAIVATAWQTAKAIASYDASRGRKFQLIQHHETWGGPQEEIEASWRLPIDKIVISKWLREIAAEAGHADRTRYVPNGMDLETFRVIRPIAVRSARRIGMLSHPEEWKGVAYGLRALELARAELGQLDVVLFGTAKRPEHLPDWIDYVHDPAPRELVDLYNGWGVYLHPSLAEGWPLPPAEAMACGCALVAAGNPGVMDYAEDGRTALVAPLRDADALAAHLVRLARDDELRRTIAEAGNEAIRAYTWTRATDAFEAFLRERLAA